MRTEFGIRCQTKIKSIKGFIFLISTPPLCGYMHTFNSLVRNYHYMKMELIPTDVSQ